MTSYQNIVRIPNHGGFGLAVLVFKLQFAGRHSYSCRWQGSGDAPPIEEAIRAHRFAYSQILMTGMRRERRHTSVCKLPRETMVVIALTGNVAVRSVAPSCLSAKYSLIVRARTWLDRDQPLDDTQTAQRGTAGSGMRLGDSWLLPLPLRRISRDDAGAAQLNIWGGGLPARRA